MLRTIEEPTVYAAGPEVFNVRRSDQKELEKWGIDNGFKILHPRRHSEAPPDQIYGRCVKDAETSDVLILDLNDFRGKCADDGTSVELGMAHRSGAILIGYKNEKEDPVLRHGKRETIDNLPVDEKGYFIEETADRNVMIHESLDAMFYGPREQVLEKIAQYIKKNVVGWYRHEDPLLGRKLLPPDTEEVFETITPNLEVELTRFGKIVDTPEMRRLREVKQLGALFWEYSDATHTRYAHSVMTFKFTADMLMHLPFNEYEKRHVLAYALTHDIAHTPYSHELEEITNLDQIEGAREIIQKGNFKKALAACDIDLETLLSFFEKEEKDRHPLRQIVSDKTLGTDKLAYLLRDGLATGKGGYDNVDAIIQHTVFEDGKLGIDEKGAESAFKQMLLYHTTYSKTYQNPKSRCNQRIFTLLGQIGLESGALPKDWHTRNDLWYDFFNIKAEESGNEGLRKLGRDGIVKRAYDCAGSLRLKGAEILERSGIHVDTITEKEYKQFLAIPVRERKIVEEELCKVAGVEPLDLIVAHGGSQEKLSVKDTYVFKNGVDKPLRLLADMHPEMKWALEAEIKKHAISIRFYPRKECADHVKQKMDEIIIAFRKIIAARTA